MSAKKARFIKTIRLAEHGGYVIVHLKDEDGQYRDHGLADLSRVELIRACAMLGIPSGSTWTSWTNEDLSNAIEAAVRGGRNHDYRNTQGGGQAPTPEEHDAPREGGGGDADGGQDDGKGGEGEAQGEGQPTDQPAEGEGEGEPADGEAQGESEGEGESDSKDEHPLLAQLAAFIREQGGIVNADDVKEVMGEAIKELTPHINTIVLPEGGMRDIPGRQHENFDLLVKCLSVKLNMYLCGPPGTGKSYASERAAEALGLKYASLSLGPQTPESRLWGYYDANGNYVRSPFRDAYEFGWLFCMDEMDNGHPGIIASTNQAIAGSGCTFPDGWVSKHENFLIVGTANTYGTGPTAEFVGRNILDPATLDRFNTLEWDVDQRVEKDMIAARLDDKGQGRAWHNALKKIRTNSAKHRIKVVCSPRAAGDGAALLSIGVPMKEALAMRVFRGLPDSQIDKLMDGVVLF